MFLPHIKTKRSKKRRGSVRNFFSFLVIVVILFVGFVVARKAYDRLTYEPPAPLPPREEVKITIIEGWGLREIAAMLEEKELATQEEFFDFVGKPGVTSRSGFVKSSLVVAYPYLKEIPTGVSLEGYLFPDTYRVFKDEGVESIVNRLVENFDAKISDSMREDIAAQHKKIYEIVTMASIVEREVHTDKDRPMVADVLWGRLRVGMPLQVDSSVNYITQKNDPGVSKKDSRVDSPYNTYRYKGLPLGPISNPGLKSLKAAIHPTETPYAYFLTDNEGNVYYSRTLDEHNENKYKYLK